MFKVLPKTFTSKREKSRMITNALALCDFFFLSLFFFVFFYSLSPMTEMKCDLILVFFSSLFFTFFVFSRRSRKFKMNRPKIKSWFDREKERKKNNGEIRINYSPWLIESKIEKSEKNGERSNAFCHHWISKFFPFSLVFIFIFELWIWWRKTVPNWALSSR